MNGTGSPEVNLKYISTLSKCLTESGNQFILVKLMHLRVGLLDIFVLTTLNRGACVCPKATFVTRSEYTYNYVLQSSE